jgi:ParB family chromosome partitioning protein
MAIPLGGDSAATPVHGETNAPFEVIPSDLLMPSDQEKPDHVTTQSPDIDNTKKKRGPQSETAPALRSSDPAGDAQPQPPPVAPRGPRLERIPTFAIKPAATISQQNLESSDLSALTASIKRNGLVQPLFVRVLANGQRYELFAGYRRWRAAIAAKLEHVPAIVFEHLSEPVILELNLLENSHRRDLTIIEEAGIFRILVEQYQRTPAQLSAMTGRSLSQVKNMLCLVALPEEVRLRLRKGQISFAHGRALVGAADPASLARRIVAEGLTLRETELLVAQSRLTAPSIEGSTATPERTSDPSDSSPSDSDSAVISADTRAKDLRLLQAALHTAIGAGLDVRMECGSSILQIEGRSAEDTANVVSVICEAMRLLRMNRMVGVMSDKRPG